MKNFILNLDPVCARPSPVAPENERELFYNPDRGFRHQIDYRMRTCEEDGANVSDPYELVARHADFFAAVHPTLAQLYVYLTDYRTTERLPESVFTRLRALFDALRKNGIRALLRFAYQTEMDGQGEASEQIMCAHMDQLFPIVAQNLDVIHVYQAGFLGAWGEWHSYTLPVDCRALLSHMLDTCPPELYIQMRLPQFKNLIDPSDPRYARLSHHNDSVFGEKQSATGGVDPGTELAAQVERESPSLPIDGELFWGGWSAGSAPECFFPDPFYVAKWLYDQRYTSLSIMHNYMENGVAKPYALSQWRTIRLSPAMLKEHDILPDEDYFSAGERSVFEYLRDHLGYRLSALEIAHEGNEVALTLQNTGFAAPHFITRSALVLLDAHGEVVEQVQTGSLRELQSRTEDGKRPTLTLRAAFSAPHGTYFLGFTACNGADTPVRLANEAVYADGINIFGKIELS